MEKNNAISTEVIKSHIYEVRGRRIMIDSDLAELYGVETKNLKRAVRMNIERFPDDFMFELTKEEYDFLRCNFFTLKNNYHKSRTERAETFNIRHRLMVHPEGTKAIITGYRPLSRPAGAKPHPTLGNARCSHNTPAPALKGQKRLTSGIAPKGQKLSPSGTARCLALKGQKQNHASSNNSFLSI